MWARKTVRGTRLGRTRDNSVGLSPTSPDPTPRDPGIPPYPTAPAGDQPAPAADEPTQAPSPQPNGASRS